MTRRWVQHAVEKPGALRRQVRSRYGDKGFTDDGTIRVEVLRKLSHVKGVTGKRANLALTLRELNKGRKH